MHNLVCDFCSSDQRFAHGLVCSPHPASFRFHLTMDTLAFGYILPTTGRIRDSHSLETCAARRTSKTDAVSKQHRFISCIISIVLIIFIRSILSKNTYTQTNGSRTGMRCNACRKRVIIHIRFRKCFCNHFHPLIFTLRA